MKMAFVAFLVALGSCARPPANEQALSALAPQVQQIRASAITGDRTGAQQKLDQLKASVDGYQKKGELAPAKASQILAAADEVNRYIPLIKPPRKTPSPRPTTPRPSPTPSPLPTPTPEQTKAPTQEPSPTDQPPPTDSGAPPAPP
ncbi:MAG: hypothetical protein ACR2M4_12000 [Actinomycetota bacterium]